MSTATTGETFSAKAEDAAKRGLVDAHVRRSSTGISIPQPVARSAWDFAFEARLGTPAQGNPIAYADFEKFPHLLKTSGCVEAPSAAGRQRASLVLPMYVFEPWRAYRASTKSRFGDGRFRIDYEDVPAKTLPDKYFPPRRQLAF